MTLFWKPEATPTELHSLLHTIAEEHPVREVSNAEGRMSNARAQGTVEVRFERVPGADCTTTTAGSVATVRYGAPNLAMRAVGALLVDSMLSPGALTEHAPFQTFGFMLDCSRNAVMKPEYLKRWLRRLCLLGYNQAMLYTEDTYEVPGEWRFGYMRGGYSGVELREIDRYSRDLGIRLVGCIQTLGHMEQILRWPEYSVVKDTDAVLLAGEERTYRLVEKLLDAMAGCLQSRRIHVGMDEVAGLGRGRYFDQSGFRRQHDIFNEHLGRVVRLCKERGLEPMIWSDTFFALGSASGDCFDPQAQVPAEVAESIPKDVQLVYWDYYHPEPEFYLNRIARHRELGFEPVMASGVWTWQQLWYNRQTTEANAGACIDACRSARLREVFFTLWGDDGAYCDFDSALAGLAFVAERSFAPDLSRLEPRFRAVCGASYEAVVAASGLTGPVRTAGILWDDPLLAMFHHEALAGTAHEWLDLARRYERVRDCLAPFWAEQGAGDIAHATLLADLLGRKIRLRLLVDEAYARRDRSVLRAALAEIPTMVARLEELAASWRRQWLTRNKPFGLEALQIRLAGQAARYRELGQRLDDFVNGRIDSIPELEQRPFVADRRISASWKNLASGSADI